jgi:hypothetical protein
MTSRVKRVGSTVGRPMAFWSPAVHDLLRYLETIGFPAPRVLESEGDVEVLTWIEGESGPEGWAKVVPESGLRRCARFLRRYHDAIAGYRPPADSAWCAIPARLTADAVSRCSATPTTPRSPTMSSHASPNSSARAAKHARLSGCGASSRRRPGSVRAISMNCGLGLSGPSQPASEPMASAPVPPAFPLAGHARAFSRARNCQPAEAAPARGHGR